MEVINNIKNIREKISNYKNNKKSIGFVPTMGFLHDGHLSLMKKAKEENDIVIVSIFVNPTQFGPNEDLDSYPRDLDRDISLCENAGVDLIFFPNVEEIYPIGYDTYVQVEGNITKKLCGESRPGHFKGVTTVVLKLFNIVTPHKAYFGQKDAQQVAIISKMVKDLNLDLEIVPCPIVRESDGLALSSRNTYLNEDERKSAVILSKSLFEAEELINNGERDSNKLKNLITNRIKSENGIIDYVSIVDSNTLEDIDILNGDVLIALAVKIGKTRLIDNVRMEV